MHNKVFSNCIIGVIQMLNHYEKLRISLRYFLIGKGFYETADAFEFAGNHHDGLRKDGKTPEFQHQIQIAHYIRTLLPSLEHPAETLTAIALHDLCEDKDIDHSEIYNRYGQLVGEAVFLLDKNGKTTANYFDGIAGNRIASIVKGGDRIHNLQSMIGVFSSDKQQDYVKEVEDYFLPMLKIARRSFLKQEAAYENIKHMLESQVELLKASLEEQK